VLANIVGPVLSIEAVPAVSFIFLITWVCWDGISFLGYLTFNSIFFILCLMLLVGQQKDHHLEKKSCLLQLSPMVLFRDLAHAQPGVMPE